MAMGSGLLALAMLAAEGPSCTPDESTTFQVRVLTLDGLDWRTSSYSRLQPVARQGSSAIWTADRALAAQLAGRARSATTYGKIMAMGEASLTRAEPVNYIASMDRYADGPINQSSAIAFLPRPDRVDERFAIRVFGRKLDQGILTRIALEETHVDVIHGVPQTESLRPGAKADRTPAEIGRQILDVVLSPGPGASGPTSITSTVQIPEVSQARVEGEWLIPNDGVLLVSLGVKTAADDKGMAVVRERVAVIEASSGADAPAANPATAEAGSPMPIAVSKLNMPALPSRSMPRAVEPDGTVIDLPPLPEAVASADLDRIKPEPNQPSPQAPALSTPGGSDPALARTSYDASPKRAVAADGSDPGARLLLLTQVLEALAKAGVAVDFDVEVGDLAATGKACEKRGAEAESCPADAPPAKPVEVAGGFKLAPETSVQLGVSLEGPDECRFSTIADLKQALKSPGRTETTLIPLGGRACLEIKATVVPAPAEKAKAAEKKGDAPTSKREIPGQILEGGRAL